MTTVTKTLNHAKAQPGILPIIGAAVMGIFLLYSAGFAKASAVHDAAHDTRHSIPFPCH